MAESSLKQTATPGEVPPKPAQCPGQPAPPKVAAVATPCRAAEAQRASVERGSASGMDRPTEPGTLTSPEARSPDQSSGTVTQTPLSTPLSTSSSTPGTAEVEVPPDHSESSRPNAQKLRISEAAADARLRRLMQPSMKTGEFKVSQEIIKQYKRNGKSKKSLQKLFETCGYDQDPSCEEKLCVKNNICSNPRAWREVRGVIS